MSRRLIYSDVDDMYLRRRRVCGKGNEMRYIEGVECAGSGALGAQNVVTS